MTINELATQLKRSPNTLTRMVADIGHGNIITIDGVGYRVFNDAGPESKYAKWRLEPDVAGNAENLTSAGGIDQRRTAAGSLDEFTKKARIKKLLAEEQLVKQRIRDHGMTMYLDWVDHMRDKMLPFASEYRSSFDTSKISDAEIDGHNKGFVKWVTKFFDTVAEDMPTSLLPPEN